MTKRTYFNQKIDVGDKVVYPFATSTSGRTLVLAQVEGFVSRRDGDFAVLRDFSSPSWMRHNLHRVRIDKLAKVSV